MNGIIIYITGSPGFKAAVITKIGSKWIHSAQDVGEDLVSFALPKDETLSGFKALIGADIVSTHDIMFFDKLPNDLPAYTHVKSVPGQAVKMSIWVNSNSKLKGSKPVIESE
jgi:hypothetical protein